MKTQFRILKFIVVLCSAVATTTVFGQVANYTWTGAANGTSLDTPGNFTTNGVTPATTLPSGQDLSGTQESVIWDGRTTVNLNLSRGAAAWPNNGLGSVGLNLVLTANQTNDLQIISSVAVSGQINTFEITNNSANATFILGDNTANQLVIITRPGIAGTVHHFVNNSANTAVINSSVTWEGGGGSACVFDFGGTGNWTVNNNLRDDNAGAFTLVWDGPGSMAWSTGGVFIATIPLGPIVINSGKVILKSPGLAPNFTGAGTVANNNSITNNGILQYDAAAQADTIARDISGGGRLIVNGGTLTLSGNNTYSGGTVISNGVLQVGTNGASGSLGSGTVTNNSSLVINLTGSLAVSTINGTGTTTVSNGTLAASAVDGTVNVNGGALAQSVDGSIGLLAIGGNLNLNSGTLVAALNKSSSPSNTVYQVTGVISYTGGTLKLLNFGPALANGDKFAIFNKLVPGGAGITIVSPGFTVNNNLGTDGSVTVATVQPAGSNVVTPSVTGGTLNLSWPSAWTGLHLQVQTNTLAQGLGTNWITLPNTDLGNNFSTTMQKTNEVFYRLAP